MTEQDHRMECPACGVFVFERWPLGWDAHAVHTCTGLDATDPIDRKVEYRRRFAEFFDSGSPVSIGSRYADALNFTYQLHWEQRRKGSDVPYIAHLLQVSGLVLEAGGDEDQAIAGLLHDAIEDAPDSGNTVPWVRDQIGKRFGPRVLAMVEACTDTDEQPKPPWRARKEAYIAALPSKSKDALLVSSADKLHNARSILADLRSVGGTVWERFTGRKDGTLWYYSALVDAYEEAFGAEGVPTTVRELREVVGQVVAEA